MPRRVLDYARPKPPAPSRENADDAAAIYVYETAGLLFGIFCLLLGRQMQIFGIVLQSIVFTLPGWVLVWREGEMSPRQRVLGLCWCSGGLAIQVVGVIFLR